MIQISPTLTTLPSTPAINLAQGFGSSKRIIAPQMLHCTTFLALPEAYHCEDSKLSGFSLGGLGDLVELLRIESLRQEQDSRYL